MIAVSWLRNLKNQKTAAILGSDNYSAVTTKITSTLEITIYRVETMLDRLYIFFYFDIYRKNKGARFIYTYN